MELLESSQALRRWRSTRPDSVGFVPTMGALHTGHASLIRRATTENQDVLVSIFVNPTQFAPGEDLDRYPRTLAADLDLCDSLGVTAVFLPGVEDLYGRADLGAGPSEALTQVQPPVQLTQGLCGRSRPTHFSGVATVVTKLLNLARPTRAYFGRKDAQQLVIIRRMAKDLNLPGEIIGCPIVREPDGLAMSSRNRYLSPAERSQAVALCRGLNRAEALLRQGVHDARELIAAVAACLQEQPDLRTDYIELVEPDTLQPLATVQSQALLAVAVYLGQTRLIDNRMLSTRQPIIAIDGPAGAGKSTVTKLVARDLGLLYLDTGAMYRSVTWAARQQGIAPDDAIALTRLLADFDLELKPDRLEDGSLITRVFVAGEEITTAIRTPEVTAQVSTVAAQAPVREFLVRMQRKLGDRGGLVAEGRDIGTNVFPQAEVKIFLTATPAERARRRARDLEAQGLTDIDLTALEQEIRDRDHQDSTREIAPLRQAEDAYELITDGMGIEQVVAGICDRYRAIVG